MELILIICIAVIILTSLWSGYFITKNTTSETIKQMIRIIDETTINEPDKELNNFIEQYEEMIGDR